jgi:hypothetical protein
VRITKDITPIFFKKHKAVKKPKQHSDSEVENEQYLHILKPSLDSFIHSYNPLNFSLLDLCIKFFLFLQKIDSSNFLQNKKEEIAIKKISKKINKKTKKGKKQ